MNIISLQKRLDVHMLYNRNCLKNNTDLDGNFLIVKFNFPMVFMFYFFSLFYTLFLDGRMSFVSLKEFSDVGSCE